MAGLRYVVLAEAGIPELADNVVRDDADNKTTHQNRESGVS